jgi:hypothetical protein
MKPYHILPTMPTSPTGRPSVQKYCQITQSVTREPLRASLGRLEEALF